MSSASIVFSAESPARVFYEAIPRPDGTSGRWLTITEFGSHAMLVLRTSAQHHDLAAQLRKAADELDAAADELEREENPCPECSGLGEVNPSWNNDPQQSRDCGACGATGVAS